MAKCIHVYIAKVIVYMRPGDLQCGLLGPCALAGPDHAGLIITSNHNNQHIQIILIIINTY